MLSQPFMQAEFAKTESYLPAKISLQFSRKKKTKTLTNQHLSFPGFSKVQILFNEMNKQQSHSSDSATEAELKSQCGMCNKQTFLTSLLFCSICIALVTERSDGWCTFVIQVFPIKMQLGQSSTPFNANISGGSAEERNFYPSHLLCVLDTREMCKM